MAAKTKADPKTYYASDRVVSEIEDISNRLHGVYMPKSVIVPLMDLQLLLDRLKHNRNCARVEMELQDIPFFCEDLGVVE